MSRRVGVTIRGIGKSPLAADGGLYLFAALMLVNVANFMFHVVVSRLLGPAAYGALGPLLGITLILLVPVTSLQVAITQAVAARHEPGREHEIALGPLLTNAVILAVVAFVALTGLSPILRSFLHLQSITAAALLGGYVVPVVIGLVPKSVLLAQRRFRAVSVGVAVGGLSRLLIGVVLVKAGRGVDGAMAATVLGEMFSAVVLLIPLRASFQTTVAGEPILIRWRDAWVATAALSGFWVLTGIDVLLARHYLPRSVSGFYTAAATAARAVLFLPSAVALVAFPRFAASDGEGVDAKTTLVQSLAVIGCSGLSAAVAILLFPRLFIEVLFGSRYGASTAVVGTLAISAACAGLVSILINFHLARRSNVALLTWPAVCVLVVAIAVFHGSMEAISLAMLTTMGTVLVVMLLPAFPGRSRMWPARDEAAGRALWELAEPDRDVTIVVPYYNPGLRFRENVERLIAVLTDSGAKFEVIAVSDGSTDDSEKQIRAIDSASLRFATLARNRGKGHALHVGLSLARGRYVGFIDADGDLAPEQLVGFLALMRLYEPDIILGSKRHPMSKVDYPLVRRIYSWGYQQVIRILFRLSVRDTQTGLKLARREVLAAALPRMLEKRFAFDLELLVVARRLGYRRLFEAPVQIGERFSSTVNRKAVWGMLVDTLAIFYRLRILRFYDRPPARGLFDEATDDIAASASVVAR